MQLSEQEIVRREAMEQIQKLGINPFPAETFPVDLKTTDFTTADFQQNLLKEIEALNGIDAAKAAELAEFIRG